MKQSQVALVVEVSSRSQPVFWIDQTEPLSRGALRQAPAHGPLPAQNATPSAPSSPSPPAAPEATPPCSSSTRTASHLARSDRAVPKPRLPSRTRLRLRPPSSRPCRRPRPGKTAEVVPEAQSEYAPKNLAQLVGTWAYSAGDCERLFQRRGGRWAYQEPVDKFAQAAIVELPKRMLSSSAGSKARL